MHPTDFIKKWSGSTLTERSGSQQHFLDLCALLGEPTPADVDQTGASYTFEKGVTKTTGSKGWADVWKRGCFAWEYKGKHKDLTAAYAQLQRYAPALENPPLLVVSDMDTIIIHTNWTATVSEIYTVAIEDLEQPEARQRLKWLFTDPEKLRPGVTRELITERAAKEFAGLAQALREQGFEAQRVAHFVNKMLFCMFAEDIGILPKDIFTRMLEASEKLPADFEVMARDLFAAMRAGGRVGYEVIDWFNGGLFDDSDVLPLALPQIKQALAAARLDWSDIEPSIFGTLFERGLDPGKRSQLGAHYTDRGSIMRLVNPVVLDPLRAEWSAVKADIEALNDKAAAAQAKADKAVAKALESMDKTAAGKATRAAKTAITKTRKAAKKLHEDYLVRLSLVRVLDPACGSANFLYLALLGLKDLEHRVNIEAEALGLARHFPAIGPECVLGIELNPYAAELARVTIWIGEIQWMLRHGFNLSKNPILKNLDQIDCRDAIVTEAGIEPKWPEAEFIVGNPPFVGDRRLIAELGEDYATRLRNLYKGRVPGGADLVTYWFEKARAQIDRGQCQRAGLVATNSIRGGANRKILDRIRDSGRIVEAWSDEPWINEGAAVRVSLIGFTGKDGQEGARLDGEAVVEVYADLTAGSSEQVDVTKAVQLEENAGVSYLGIQKSGPFNVTGDQARDWLSQPSNPNGQPNSDVVRPWMNGLDITRRPRDMWIIDFGTGMSLPDAALYESPFHHVQVHVKPTREGVRRKAHRENWWRYGDARPGMREAIEPLPRFIVTPEVSKYRLFTWLRHPIMPDKNLIVIAREDDITFGILHSRFHELWSLRQGTSLEDRPRYTSTTTFRTFPFPEGLQPNIPAEDYADDPRAVAIAAAAQRLVTLRDNWLNPPEWVKRVPEVVPGYPDRILPVDEAAAKQLKKRTLTNLYNARPAWLSHAHDALDAAVANAYGWEADIEDGEVLKRLLELNQERAACN